MRAHWLLAWLVIPRRPLPPGRGRPPRTSPLDRSLTVNLLEGAIGIRVPGDGHVYVVDTARGLLIFNEP